MAWTINKPHLPNTMQGHRLHRTLSSLLCHLYSRWEESGYSCQGFAALFSRPVLCSVYMHLFACDSGQSNSSLFNKSTAAVKHIHIQYKAKRWPSLHTLRDDAISVLWTYKAVFGYNILAECFHNSIFQVQDHFSFITVSPLNSLLELHKDTCVLRIWVVRQVSGPAQWVNIIPQLSTANLSVTSNSLHNFSSLSFKTAQRYIYNHPVHTY